MASGSWLDRGGIFGFISGSLVVFLLVVFTMEQLSILISIVNDYLDSLY